MSDGFKLWILAISQVPNSLFPWVINNGANRDESLTLLLPLHEPALNFQSMPYGGKSCVRCSMPCYFLCVAFFFFFLLVMYSMCYCLLSADGFYDMRCAMFWKRAQTESKPWIQNNAATFSSIHEHFFKFLF